MVPPAMETARCSNYKTPVRGQTVQLDEGRKENAVAIPDHLSTTPAGIPHPVPIVHEEGLVEGSGFVRKPLHR